MKLSDYKNEEAIDLMADIIEPFTKIFSDKRVKTAAKGKDGDRNMLAAIKVALKHHPKEVVQILARIDSVPVEEYEIDALTLPFKVMELLNDPALKSLFPSAEKSGVSTYSGSATENTEAIEE